MSENSIALPFKDTKMMGNGSPPKEQDLPLCEEMHVSSPFSLGTYSLDVRNLGHSCSLLLPSHLFPASQVLGSPKGKVEQMQGGGQGSVRNGGPGNNELPPLLQTLVT